jgi:LSD1 subclass zinc finger protein
VGRAGSPLSGDKGSEPEVHEFKCPGCSAFLKFEPGTTHLKCPYCESEFPIVQEKEEIRELDYTELVSRGESHSEVEETLAVHCSSCGADIVLPPNVITDVCPYCASSILPDRTISKKNIKPQSLLPFDAGEKEINELFKKWLKGLWFAPGNLKKFARTDQGIKGIYVPYWTYDAKTHSVYEGARGDFYYEPETFVTVVKGRRVMQTRMVQKVRWTPAQGAVRLSFDDVLVLGSKSLPPEYAQMLEPWDLTNLQPYNEKYLSGFISESYQLGVQDGFEIAKQRMSGAIRNAILADVGGDVQQIHSADISYDEITFKHVLLPVWINSYRYHGKVYRFLVNARTGEVQGERPWSWIKIALFAAFVFAVTYGFVMILANLQ